METNSGTHPKGGGADNHGYENTEHKGEKDDRQPAFSVVTAKEDEDDELHQCGWFSWTPRFLQRCHSVEGYLFFLCVYVFLQGMIANGLVFVVITTLERRFGMDSTQSGMIVSSYDFAAMCALVFVTYYGDRGSKPRYLGSGAFLFGLGSIIFALPHFLSDDYNFEGTLFDTCNTTRPVPDRCSANPEDLSKYYAVFIIAQIIHGIGSTPLYTLGIAYLDENSSPGNGALYLGIFQAISIIGPSIGFIGGGFILDGIYVDFDSDIDTLPINAESPLWVGAWWIGFLVCGCLNMLIAIPLLGFGKQLPGSRQRQKERKIESQAGAEFNVRPGFGHSLQDLPRATWTLLKNPPYLFLTLVGCTELFIIAYVTAFLPKILESIFSMTAGNAAILAGVIGMPAGLISNVFTGWLIKTYDWKVPAMLKYMLVSLVLALIGGLSFLWICPNVDFAGVTVQYGPDKTPVTGGSIYAECNYNCSCEHFFDPVCGSDDVMYFTACFAGCQTELEPTGDGIKRYKDCSCIPDEISLLGGTADTGRCQGPCWTIVGFIIMFFLVTIFAFNSGVPSITSTLRCVDPSQRSFALGLQSLLVKALGLIPGPIAYGHLIKDACLIWEQSCSGNFICWMYENAKLSYLTVGIGSALRFGSVVFISLALFTYKPAKERSPDPEEMEKDKEALVVNNSVSYATVGVQAGDIPVGVVKRSSEVVETTEL